jgi:arylsulfatase A
MRLPALLALTLTLAPAGLTAAPPPNFIIIFADDLGYGDLGSQGHPTIRTPHLDRLAAEGMRFTEFYAAAPVCTPSRAALLTGRYAVRSGMYGRRGVLFPDSPGGLPASEITLARLLGAQGYRTAHLGKWHLGIHPGGRHLDHGFDRSFGIPYSNDMDRRASTEHALARAPNPPVDGWDVPLLRDNEVIERPVDQRTLTRRLTDEAVRFIRESGEQPFFLYLAHPFPHVPLFASPAFHGRSARGIYGDTVEEIDASTGEIVAALQAAGIAGRTLVVFTSDNGPWLTQGLQGGSAGLLRDGKGSTWEGGMRVPALFWWPGRIQPGVVRGLAHTMDLFPTAAALAGAPLPTDRPLDGRDLSPTLLQGAPLPDRPFFYYRSTEVAACRLGDYKLHLITQDGFSRQPPVTHERPLLFHLGRDPSEQHDIAADHPEVVARILAAIEAHRAAVVIAPPQHN